MNFTVPVEYTWPLAMAPGGVTLAAQNPLLVVGLGASAGGLEALEQFFRPMPTDTGMAFDGFRRSLDGIWLLRLMCTRCTTAIPQVVVVLEPF